MINIIEKINFYIIFLLITWQKIIPLILLKFSNSLFNVFLATISILYSRLIAFYQNSIRKLLAYSSIINTRWLLIIFAMNKTIWIHFFILYSLITVSIINLIKTENINLLSNIFIKSTKSGYRLLILSFTLSGLPPSSGFILKLILLKLLILQNLLLLIIILILTSVTRFYFYSRIFFSIISISPSFKIRWTKIKPKFNFNIITRLSFLPLITLLK